MDFPARRFLTSSVPRNGPGQRSHGGGEWRGGGDWEGFAIIPVLLDHNSSWKLPQISQHFPLNSLDGGESLATEGRFDFLEKAKNNLKLCIVNKQTRHFQKVVCFCCWDFFFFFKLKARWYSRIEPLLEFPGSPVVGGFPGGANGKEPTCQCRLNVRDTVSGPGSGRSPERGHGNPLQYSCLEKPMDRGTWQAAVHRVTQSGTQLSNLA